MVPVDILIPYTLEINCFKSISSKSLSLSDKAEHQQSDAVICFLFKTP